MKPMLVGDKYASKTFTVGATTTYDVGASESIFSDIGTCDVIYLKTDVDINIKLNSTDNDAIPVKTSENLIPIPLMGVSNIFIITGANPANISLLLLS